MNKQKAILFFQRVINRVDTKKGRVLFNENNSKQSYDGCTFKRDYLKITMSNK